MVILNQDKFHPVILLPKHFIVFDFSIENKTLENNKSPYGIGKYLEKRTGMYSEDFFKSGNEVRDIHMGIDISAPVNTEVHSFSDATLFDFAHHDRKGDYGGTIITEQYVDGVKIYSLYGHLSKKSLLQKKRGEKIKKGDVIAWLGSEEENGGWPPHLHFQLSTMKPIDCDMPGVVSNSQLEEAKKIYPDPRIVLGNLYP